MKPLRLLLLLSACANLTACSLFNTYFERKDTITLGAGDAVASNIAIQTADPWPRNVGDNNIPMDGTKAAIAMLRYRFNGSNGVGGGANGVGPGLNGGLNNGGAGGMSGGGLGGPASGAMAGGPPPGN